jgi:hypothetical protein
MVTASAALERRQPTAIAANWYNQPLFSPTSDETLILLVEDTRYLLWGSILNIDRDRC